MLTEEHKALLRKVKAHILEEPARLRMSDWLIKGLPGEFHYSDTAYHEPEQFLLPACGTAGCIAGWINFLTTPQGTPVTLSPSRAGELIGLGDKKWLFYVEDWPPVFRERWMDLRLGQQTERAQIVGELLDYYIEREGEFEEGEF